MRDVDLGRHAVCRSVNAAPAGCSHLCGAAQGLRQPAARPEQLQQVVDDQLSLLVIPHHGHEHLGRVGGK